MQKWGQRNGVKSLLSTLAGLPLKHTKVESRDLTPCGNMLDNLTNQHYNQKIKASKFLEMLEKV